MKNILKKILYFLGYAALAKAAISVVIAGLEEMEASKTPETNA